MAYSSSLTDPEWAIIAPLLPQKKRTCPPTVDKTPDSRRGIVPTEERLQLGGLAPRPAALLHGVLALQAMARRRGTRHHSDCFAWASPATSQKKLVW